VTKAINVTTSGVIHLFPFSCSNGLYQRTSPPSQLLSYRIADTGWNKKMIKMLRQEQLAGGLYPPGGNEWSAAHVSLGEQRVLRLTRRIAEDLFATAVSGSGNERLPLVDAVSMREVRKGLCAVDALRKVQQGHVLWAGVPSRPLQRLQGDMSSYNFWNWF
jgi:hypothetical protein